VLAKNGTRALYAVSPSLICARPANARRIARCPCGGGRMATRPTTTDRSADNAHILSDVLERSGHSLRCQASCHAERPADAEEALQSACLLFLERYRGNCEPLAWLYTTLKREAWRIARRASRRHEHGFGDFTRADGQPVNLTELLSDQAPPLEERTAEAQLLEARSDALPQLKPAQHQAHFLFASEYRYREIAGRLGWTRTKVNRLLPGPRRAVLSASKRVETIVSDPSASRLFVASQSPVPQTVPPKASVQTRPAVATRYRYTEWSAAHLLAE
jgi:DNA-directed RNA polymerase specialized sigma24 family protein